VLTRASRSSYVICRWIRFAIALDGEPELTVGKLPPRRPSFRTAAIGAMLCGRYNAPKCAAERPRSVIALSQGDPGMAPADPKHALQQCRAEHQRRQQALNDAGRRVQQRWAAEDRRSAACQQLLDIWPGQGTGPVDGDRVAALLVQWAATLPADWVHARVQFVRQRLALATQTSADAPLKEILLQLLLHACARDSAAVAAFVHEALRGGPDEVLAFRQGL